MTISLTKQLRQAKGTNNEALQGVYCIATPSATYKITPAASTDPFSTKTNKYAQSKVVRIATQDKGCHVRFGDSSIGAATTSDHMIPQNSYQDFAIDENYPYCRIIENANTAIVTVTELY